MSAHDRSRDTSSLTIALQRCSTQLHNPRFAVVHAETGEHTARPPYSYFHVTGSRTEIQVIDVIVYFARGACSFARSRARAGEFGSRIPRIVDAGRDVNTVIRQPFSGAVTTPAVALAIESANSLRESIRHR